MAALLETVIVPCEVHDVLDDAAPGRFRPASGTWNLSTT